MSIHYCYPGQFSYKKNNKKTETKLNKILLNIKTANSNFPFPVNGNWGAWNDPQWGTCSGGPGEAGKKVRTLTRECGNPKPSHGGKDCPTNLDGGSKVESDNCSKLTLIPTLINEDVTLIFKNLYFLGNNFGRIKYISSTCIFIDHLSSTSNCPEIWHVD